MQRSLSILRSQKGMTLIEIMIVLVIIAGLMGILGTGIMSRYKKSQINQAKIIVKDTATKVDMFYSDCGFYPSTDQGLKALVEAPSDCKNWGPDPYLPKLPKDPWNNELIYEGKGSTYVIKSLGADKKEGGAGVDQDISSEDL